MKNIIAPIFGIIIFCVVLYGIYWIAKTVSYQVFYEGMVIETVKDMVKPEYLK